MKRTVNILITDASGRLYLQFRDGTAGICHPLEWNLFGGGVDPGEDILQAAIRELFEETHVKADPEDLEVVFEGEVLGKEFTTSVRLKHPVKWSDIDIHEGAGCGRFTNEELARLKVTPITREILNAVSR